MLEMEPKDAYSVQVAGEDNSRLGSRLLARHLHIHASAHEISAENLTCCILPPHSCMLCSDDADGHSATRRLFDERCR